MANQRGTGVTVAGNRVTEYFRDHDSMTARLSALAAGGGDGIIYGRSNGLHYLCYRGAVAMDGAGQGDGSRKPS